MAIKLEMIEIRLMSYYLGIDVKQFDEGIFVSQKNYAVKTLREFNIENC